MTARLELTWPNKDKFLLNPKDDAGRPVWVERDHPAAHEVRITDFTAAVGVVNDDDPYADNLLFIGDSLDALRVLNDVPAYRRHYRGKVKLAYWDPPFNTGQTFVHYDDWMEHSTWLSFMRDRLVIARDLLATDGSIWIHLDDAEVHRMRSLLDEVFGPENFVGTVVWQKAYSPRNDATGFSTDQDYILIYSASPGWRANRFGRLASRDALYASADEDPRAWVSGDPAAPGARTHQGMVYAIQSPFTGDLFYPAIGRHWSSGQDGMKALIEEWGVEYELRDIGDAARRAVQCDLSEIDVRPGVMALMVKGSLEEARATAQARYDQGAWPRLYFTKGGKGGLKLKRYLDEVAQDRAPQTLWLHEEVGHNRSAKAEIKALVPGVNPFATPKPEALLQRVLQIGSNPGDIVLDCFAGSGTTAAVAHKMGRRWVTSELSTDTVEHFTLPRLRKVVAGEDPGGITTTATIESVGDLPGGVTAQQSKEAMSVFNALAANGTFAGIEETASTALLAAVRAAGKTKKVVTQNWSGGGGFRVVEVGPSMYEVTPYGTALAEWATNGRFARAVAGQLGFEWHDGKQAPFCGTRGRMRLAVLDGAVGEEEVRQVIAALDERERVTIVAKTVLPGAEMLLADLSRGSRIRKAPRDILVDRTRPRRTQKEAI